MDRSRTRNVVKRGLRNRVDMVESWTSHYNEEQRVGARCLLGLALRGYLVCGGFHLLVASQVVGFIGFRSLSSSYTRGIAANNQQLHIPDRSSPNSQSW